MNVCQAVRAVCFIAGRSVSGGRLKAEHRPDRLLRSWSRTAPVDMSCLERISPKAVVYEYAAASKCLDYSVPPSGQCEPSK